MVWKNLNGVFHRLWKLLWKLEIFALKKLKNLFVSIKFGSNFDFVENLSKRKNR